MCYPRSSSRAGLSTSYPQSPKQLARCPPWQSFRCRWYYMPPVVPGTSECTMPPQLPIPHFSESVPTKKFPYLRRTNLKFFTMARDYAKVCIILFLFDSTIVFDVDDDAAAAAVFFSSFVFLFLSFFLYCCFFSPRTKFLCYVCLRDVVCVFFLECPMCRTWHTEFPSISPCLAEYSFLGCLRFWC